MRSLKILVFVALAALLGLGLGGCVFEGTSYLALDYTTLNPPLEIAFPMLPSYVTYGAYYEHPEGTYSAEYRSSNGTYWSFNYLIEVNYGFVGDSSADRFYTLYCDNGGPWLTHFDVASLQSLGGKTAASAPTVRQQEADLSAYDLEHPEPYLWEKSEDGVTFRIEGKRYRLKEG